MRNFRYLILLILLISSSARAGDPAKEDWMNTSLSGLGKLFGCLELPTNSSFHTGSVPLDLANSGMWVATNSNVTGGKAIKFEWSTIGATANPRKYRVLYRIDPRFNKPQIFIKTYNYLTKKFEALGFPKFNSSVSGKDIEALSFKKMQDYVDYFNFINNKKIRVDRGDVVSITLVDSGNFFVVDTEDDILKTELDYHTLPISALYTKSNVENKMIYSSSERLCDVVDPLRKGICSGSGADTKYKVGDNSILAGKPINEIDINNISAKTSSCPSMASGKDIPFCFYDQGRGMRISINSQIIKREEASFIESSAINKSFLYYKSDVAGDLDFTTNWQIQDMFTKLEQPMMVDWVGKFTDIDKLRSYINGPDVDLSADFLHFGRYVMVVEIGSGDNTISTAEQQNIEVEYIIIKDTSTPSSSTSGMPVSKEFIVDADKTGYLWVRVKNPSSAIAGTIVVKYANYTGSTWFSDIVYKGAIKPIVDKFQGFTRDLYTKLAQNASLQRAARVALTLYIAIFGIMFLIGTVQFTASELVVRLAKITIIVILLSKDSWHFFNQYFFNLFMHGTDYLMTNIVGLTSSKSNIFGFIDPIFDKYTNGQIWGLLFIQLLQIHNGLTLIAIMTIYSLILYFRSILEVIIGYVIAFVGIAVMIAIAPFFIIAILFERTKSLFDNWISTLFSYMIQPSILLIFFLLIDQVMSTQLLKVVVRACWGTLIPIAIGLDLTHLDIPINFSFTLDFLPGIPFFIPQIPPIGDVGDLLHPKNNTFLVLFTTSLLFYSYCLMCYGLVDYVTIVVAQLTNVTPARKEGDFQKPVNPTESIIQDLNLVTDPIKDVALAPVEVFKDKIIDQNYRARKGTGSDNGKDAGYTGKIFASRDDGGNKNE